MRIMLPGRGRSRNVLLVERSLSWTRRPRWWHHRDYISLWWGALVFSVQWEEE